MKYFFLLAFLGYFSCAGVDRDHMISLQGKWNFIIDPYDTGVNEQWYLKKLDDVIFLPGSMKENGKGLDPSLETIWTGSIYDSSWFFNPSMEKYRQPGNIKFPFWLTPVKYYTGPAWYQKQVRIPEDWRNKRIVLYLERPHWETMVWIDSLMIGSQNSLSTPHIYELTEEILPGMHTITIRIDNRIKEINVGPDSHSLTDHTQGNWNGITGDIYLKAGSPVYFRDIKLFPAIETKSVKATLIIENSTGKAVSGEILLSARSFNSPVKHQIDPLTTEFRLDTGKTSLELTYQMGDKVQLWDEFNPALYKFTAVLNDEYGNRDLREIHFGMREFKTSGTRFEINGRPVFLRGTVECCTFPLSGYPPTDPDAWERIFLICREYGLNHMRFHSWCPPEAAFVAADKTGFYLHVEGPSWANHGTALGYGRPIDHYIYEETERIVNAYGNHPSFCMMAYGNEPAGRNQVKYLGEFVSYWKAKDNRRVYTHASIGMSWPLVPESEFIVRSGPRGLPWDRPPETMFDYRSRIEGEAKPYITHEMGQWCVFPNFKEIEKYTGVYRAKNFELFREDLHDHNMEDQAEDFLMASGKLQVLCYKSEIEAALRTPGLAGFQLLSLNDFPGQGTALVGVLDVFWDEKGYVTPWEFTCFCNQTVPLARINKFVYTNDEIFTAGVEIAHFGEDPLQDISPEWIIRDANGKLITNGTFSQQDIPIGSNIQLGTVHYNLSGIQKAKKLNLEVRVGKFTNNWDFWVNPEELPEVYMEDIYICNELNDEAESFLNNGGKVLLLAAGKVEKGKELVQHLKPVFWNTSWFRMRPPHTTGILCDPMHPIFSEFPAEYHSNLQWWEIIHGQQVMILDHFPSEFRPLVQPIDTWFLNRRLGLIFEAKVGEGKIIVCSADIQSNPEERPAAR